RLSDPAGAQGRVSSQSRSHDFILLDGEHSENDQGGIYAPALPFPACGVVGPNSRTQLLVSWIAATCRQNPDWRGIRPGRSPQLAVVVAVIRTSRDARRSASAWNI